MPDGPKKPGKPENLARGLTPNQERGSDGKIRRKGEAAEGAGPDVPALSTATVPDAEAMQYVVSHGADETHQQAYFRRLMDKEPKWFAERLAKLQGEREGSTVSPDTVGPKWDGTGPCPTCGHEPESVGEAEPVELLIEQMLAGEVGGGEA